MVHLATIVTAFSLGASGDVGVQAEIDALRADLRTLQRSQAQGALDAERANEIRAIVKDALADASTRTMMQDGRGQPAFQGDSFYRLDASGTEITSADGNFRYHLNVHMQLRFIWNHREELGDTQGFEIRRTRFIMDGHAFGKEWRYALQISRPSGVPSPRVPDIEDAWVGRVLSPELQLKMGQFRPAFTREEMMSSATTLFMERSALNNYFRAARSRGIALEWETEHFMWRSGWFDGITVRSPSTPGGADWNTGNTVNLPWDNRLAIDWAFSSRFDWKLNGTWRELREYTPWLDMKGQATNLGVAVDAEQASPSAPFPADPWMIEVTADLMHKQAGWSLFTWGVFRRVQSDDGQSNQWGALVQASTM
ncbi:MAG: porin, partial [Planctomycetota bacterium]